MTRFSLVNQSCFESCVEAGLSRDDARLVGLLYGLIHRGVLSIPQIDPVFEIVLREFGGLRNPHPYDARTTQRMLLFRAPLLPTIHGAVWTRPEMDVFFSVRGPDWCAYWRRRMEYIASENTRRSQVDVIRLEGMDAMRRDLAFLRLTVDA